MNEARPPLAAVDEAARAGRPIVLATIVRAKGSTPRGVGSRMAIDPEQGPVGTVGGGCGEAEVIEAARRALVDGRALLIRVDLTEDLYSWSPAVCGGVFDVLVEPLRASVEDSDSSESPSVRRAHRLVPPQKRLVSP